MSLNLVYMCTGRHILGRQLYAPYLLVSLCLLFLCTLEIMLCVFLCLGETLFVVFILGFYIFYIYIMLWCCCYYVITLVGALVDIYLICVIFIHSFLSFVLVMHFVALLIF